MPVHVTVIYVTGARPTAVYVATVMLHSGTATTVPALVTCPLTRDANFWLDSSTLYSVLCLCKDIKDKARTVGMSHMSKVETMAFILVLKWVLWSWTRVRAAVCFVSKITVQVCGFEDKGNEFSAQENLSALLGKKTAASHPERREISDGESDSSATGTGIAESGRQVEVQDCDEPSFTIEDETADEPAAKRLTFGEDFDFSHVGTLYDGENCRRKLCPRTAPYKTKVALANQHWTRTKSFPYPVRVLNKKRRTFQPSWQDRFPWLAYSKKLDSVFCLPSVLFAASGQHLGQLYYQPFNNWTKSTAEFTRHESQKAHETSMVRFADFERTASGESEKADVATQLSSEHQRQAEENMTRLRSAISTVMFLGRQNICNRISFLVGKIDNSYRRKGCLYR